MKTLAATTTTRTTPTPTTGAEKVHTDTSSASDRSAEWLDRANSLQQQGYVIGGLKQRVAECRTRPVLRSSKQVGASVSASGNLRVLGLQDCESRWCPTCWGKKSEERGDFVTHALRGARSLGLVAGMLTLTADHTTTETKQRAREEKTNPVYLQDVTELFELLVASWRSSVSGEGGTRLNASMYAYYRAAEVTVDDLTKVAPGRESGSHFHYHVLLIAESTEQLQAHADLRQELWKKACAKHGLSVSDKGLDLTIVKDTGDKDSGWAAEYVTKGEGMDKVATEITRASVKDGHESRRCSPEQVLRNIGLLSPSKLRTRLIAQWQAVEKASTNIRWKTNSASFAELAELGRELAEEERQEEETTSIEDQVAVCDWDELCGVTTEIQQALDHTKILWNGRTDNGRGMTLFHVLCMVLEDHGITYEITTSEEFTERLRVAAADRHRLEDEGIDEVGEPVQLSLDVAGHREAADRMRAWAWGLSA